MLETIVIGGGPYGLSATSHLRKAGVETKTFGSPMSFWRDHTPAGMMLRSALSASDIASPHPGTTLAAYLGRLGAVPEGPVPVSSFVDYGTWFQARRLPDIDRRHISGILAEQDGFCVVAEDGETFRAKRVVVATGIAGFAHQPSAFDYAPNSLVSHSNDNSDPARFRGRRVGIIGSGQSAIETAALMREAGAEVEVIMRAARIRWLQGAVGLRDQLGPLGRLMFPWTDVGSPPFNQVIARPALFRSLPAVARVSIDRRTMRASVAAWLKPRIDGVRLTNSRTVVRAEPRHDQIGLVLDDASVRKFDYVVLATGFRINLARLSFLNRELLAAIRRSAGYPHLNYGFESSVKGLHFIGATAAYSFGSVTRFVAGTTYSAAALTAAICTSSRRVPNAVARPEGAPRSPRKMGLMLSAKQSALNTAGPCQSPELLASSSPYPRFLTRLRLLSWYMEREGLLGALRRTAIALVPGLRTAQRKTTRVEVWENEIPHLQPGEWIEVKSRDEILSTLDQNAKHRGLRFVPKMYDFCGRRFRVFKRVEKICIENTPDVRRIMNTVLLEGGVCQGGGIGCDRACFHFWREVWLRRVSPVHSVDGTRSAEAPHSVAR